MTQQELKLNEIKEFINKNPEKIKFLWELLFGASRELALEALCNAFDNTIEDVKYKEGVDIDNEYARNLDLIAEIQYSIIKKIR